MPAGSRRAWWIRSRSPGGQVFAVPGERRVHNLAQRLPGIDLVMAEALQHDELLGLAGALVQRPALLRRYQPVVVGCDEQHRARRDAVDHPLGIEAERVVDVL